MHFKLKEPVVSKGRYSKTISSLENKRNLSIISKQSIIRRQERDLEDSMTTSMINL